MTSAIGRLGTLALAIGILSSTGRTDASLITYTETVTASGSLGGTSYTNALVTLIATGDTTGIELVGISVANPVSVTLTISGLAGQFTFTDPFVVFRSGSLAGIARGTPTARGSDLLGVNNSVFNTYDLASEIGPISGTPTFNSTTGFATTGGTFFISSVSGNATFQATIPAPVVPEPSSLALCALGGIAMAVRSLGRKRVRLTS